jgi:hypothetical protein
MKHLFKWLTERLSQPKKTVEDDQPSNPESVKPDEDDLDLPGIQDLLKDAPKPDIYSDVCDATVPNLKALDLDLTDVDDSPAFDPDDTVNMHNK